MEASVDDDEPEYVAHFWAGFLRGRPHTTWGDVIVFEVDADDRATHPELASVELVAIRVTDGVVHETSPEDAAIETLRSR